MKDTPSYSLGSRPKEAKKYITPAPGAYESSDTNQYKDKAPAFSLSIRYPVPADTALKPGPGAYTPEKVSRGGGAGLELAEFVAGLLHDNPSDSRFVLFRLTQRVISLSTALGHVTQSTCLVQDPFLARRPGLYLTNNPTYTNPNPYSFITSTNSTSLFITSMSCYYIMH